VPSGQGRVGGATAEGRFQGGASWTRGGKGIHHWRHAPWFAHPNPAQPSDGALHSPRVPLAVVARGKVSGLADTRSCGRRLCVNVELGPASCWIPSSAASRGLREGQGLSGSLHCAAAGGSCLAGELLGSLEILGPLGRSGAGFARFSRPGVNEVGFRRDWPEAACSKPPRSDHDVIAGVGLVDIRGSFHRRHDSGESAIWHRSASTRVGRAVRARGNIRLSRSGGARRALVQQEKAASPPGRLPSAKGRSRHCPAPVGQFIGQAGTGSGSPRAGRRWRDPGHQLTPGGGGAQLARSAGAVGPHPAPATGRGLRPLKAAADPAIATAPADGGAHRIRPLPIEQDFPCRS